MRTAAVGVLFFPSFRCLLAEEEEDEELPRQLASSVGGPPTPWLPPRFSRGIATADTSARGQSSRGAATNTCDPGADPAVEPPPTLH
jgi:hypothetical protein